MDYFKFFTTENKSGWKCVEKLHLKNEPEIHKNISDFINQENIDERIKSLPFKQKIYHFIFNLKDIPKCLSCQKDVNYKGTLKKGYAKFCSDACGGWNDITKKKIQETNIKKFGVNHYTETNEFKIKAKETFIKNYGKENPLLVNSIREKIKKTNLEKYGMENPLSLSFIKDKIKKTNLERYGVENIIHNSKIFEKNQKSGFRSKKYKNTKINYRGSFEKNFLDKFYNKIKIRNGTRLEYFLDNKKSYYFPDFYCKEFNLIVEIKSSYHFKLDEIKNLAKQQACLEQGFEFMFIIDKDYKEFIKKVKIHV